MSEHERPELCYQQVTMGIDYLSTQLRRPYSTHKRLVVGELFERIDASGRIRTPLSNEKKYALEALLGEQDILRPGYYVEINPTPQLRELPRVFTAESPYIGVERRRNEYLFPSAVEMDKKQNETAMLNLELQMNKDYASLIFRNSTGLDFPNGSAQEVFLGNVLLSTGMKTESIFDLLVEVKRVLNPQTGIVIIGERHSVSDSQPGSTYRPIFGKLGVILANAGFNERLLFDNHETQTFQTMHSLLNWPTTATDPVDAQFIIAKPSLPPQPRWWQRK